MNHNLIREKFRKFFESRGHTWVPSSSLLPDDPSVLFTTAGMQQFKPYYTGEADPIKDFSSLNTASIQKSMRTSDIDEVGDETHLTFFEMLGNFSFGGYWKKEAIEYAHEFITKEMGLTIDYVSVFGGESEVSADEESEKIWKSLDSNIEIKKMGRADNFWGPTGVEGPCGPTTEIYVNGVEIWNVVFNQCYQYKDKKLEPLKTQGIDTGMGLERLAMVVQRKDNIFETDLFKPLLDLLPDSIDIRTKRIIADHARAVVFLMADNIRPSNKDQGYVLRKLVRRVMSIEYKYKLSSQISEDLLVAVIEMYKIYYSELEKNKNEIISSYFTERQQFKKTFELGLRWLKKFEDYPKEGKTITGEEIFFLSSTFGIPSEFIAEFAKDKKIKIDMEGLKIEIQKHQEKSRAGLEKKFGGHGLLLDTGELKAANEEELKIVTRLHTATHLLQAALRKVLGKEVHQAGSDITVERTRFDFTFPRKLTPEEIRQVEDWVNGVIQSDLTVDKQTLSREEAEKTGALHFFKIKYPEQVDVYTVGGDPDDPVGAGWFSKELCGGPHVTHSGEIGHFKIIKEEASSAGVRRIRAIVR